MPMSKKISIKTGTTGFFVVEAVLCLDKEAFRSNKMFPNCHVSDPLIQGITSVIMIAVRLWDESVYRISRI